MTRITLIQRDGKKLPLEIDEADARDLCNYVRPDVRVVMELTLKQDIAYPPPRRAKRKAAPRPRKAAPAPKPGQEAKERAETQPSVAVSELVAFLKDGPASLIQIVKHLGAPRQAVKAALETVGAKSSGKGRGVKWSLPSVPPNGKVDEGARGDGAMGAA